MSSVCYLSEENKSTTRLDKLNWIEVQLAKSDSLELLGHFTQFFKDQNFQRRWNSDESAVFTKIQQNAALKEQLQSLVASDKPWLERTQADVELSDLGMRQFENPNFRYAVSYLNPRPGAVSSKINSYSN